MTFHSTHVEEAIEPAVKVVKLVADDWRKLALAALVLFCAGTAVAYNLVVYIAKSEVTRLEEKDVAAGIRTDAIEVRVRKLEDAAASLEVVKNDVRWIRRELEKNQPQSPAPR